MPQEPAAFFGWLLNICVSDDSSKRSGEALSAAVIFASGMAASGLTIYLAGVLHLL